MKKILCVLTLSVIIFQMPKQASASNNSNNFKTVAIACVVGSGVGLCGCLYNLHKLHKLNGKKESGDPGLSPKQYAFLSEQYKMLSKIFGVASGAFALGAAYCWYKSKEKTDPGNPVHNFDPLEIPMPPDIGIVAVEDGVDTEQSIRQSRALAFANLALNDGIEKVTADKILEHYQETVGIGMGQAYFLDKHLECGDGDPNAPGERNPLTDQELQNAVRFLEQYKANPLEALRQNNDFFENIPLGQRAHIIQTARRIGVPNTLIAEHAN